MHTLECTVLLCVMFGSVASIATWKIDKHSVINRDELLEGRIEDQLAVWNDQPLGPEPCTAASVLEALALEGIAGDHKRWYQSMERYGPAIDADLVLTNGAGIMTLHGPGDIVGASGDVWWSPDQNYALPLPTTDASSGAESLVIDVPTVNWASTARIRGEAVRMVANYEGAGAGAEAHLLRWVPLAIVPENLATGSVVLMLGDSPNFHISLRSEVPGETNRRVSVNIQSPSRIVASGTVVLLEFPDDWGADLESHSDWHVELAPGGLRVAASRDTTATSMHVWFTIPVTPGRAPDIVRASLSNGALGHSTMVVTYPASTERNLPRFIETTTPYAVEPGEWTLLGGVVVNGGDPMTLTSLRIDIPGGYDLSHNGGAGAPLFAEIAPNYDDEDDPENELPKNEPRSGWSRAADGRSMTWTGDIEIPEFSAQQFYVRVRIAEDVTTAIEPPNTNGPNATLLFSNGYKTTSNQWGKSPGIIRFRVPPATRPLDHPDGQGGSADGYPWKIAPLPGEPAQEVAVWANSSMGRLRNTTSYKLSAGSADIVSFEHAAANATVEVEERRVPLGGIAHVRGNLESLVRTLNEAGIDSTLALELYAPISMGCEPTHQADFFSSSMPASEVTAAVVWDVDGIGTVTAATGDMYLHRVDVGGEPLWSTPTAGVVEVLERMDRGPTQRLVLAGTSTGHVTAYRMSDGAQFWIASPSPATTSTKVGVLRYDTLDDRIYAGMDGGFVGILSPEDGDTLVARETLLVGDVRDLRRVGDIVYVLTTAHVYRLDADTLQGDAIAPATGLGMAIGPSMLLIATPTGYDRVDLQTLTATHVVLGETVLAARGDATGDGVEDLVLFDGTMFVTAIDGTTGVGSYRRDVAGGSLAGDSPLARTERVRGLEPVAGETTTCEPIQVPVSYAATVSCNGDLDDEPLEMHAASGLTTVAFRSDGDVVVGRLDASGTFTWRYTTPEARTVTALDAAAWLTEAHATLYGDAAGGLFLHGDDGARVLASTPSTRVGHFSLYVPVPEGAFYGTHLVVARLRWAIANGEPQEARLVDWFEVVSKDGAPVVKPSYRIALTMEQVDEPFELGAAHPDIG